MAAWCVRHRRLVALAWVGVFVLTTLVARAAGNNYTDNLALPHTESTEAIQLLQAASPRVSGDTEQIVVQTHGVPVTTPAIEHRVEAMLARVADIGHVTRVVSPYSLAGVDQVSRSGTVAFANVTFDRSSSALPADTANRLIARATSADSSQVHVAVAGALASQTTGSALGGLWLGIVLAGIVLLLVFGSLFATLAPLASAAAALGTAVAVNGMISNVLDMPNFSNQLVLLIGLGVGIDYALFIVTRHRQGLRAGQEVDSSIVTAVDTSGRAVLFAGIIVCIALLGMLLMGIHFLYGMAVAAAIGVLCTMVAALTLLPALLGFMGLRVFSRRQRRRQAERGPITVGVPPGFWTRWARTVERRPLLIGLAGLMVVVVLALPFFALRLGSGDAGNDPAGSTTRQAYDMLAQGFGPGFNGPLELVSVVHGPSEQAAEARVALTVAHQPGVASVAPLQVIPGPHESSVDLVVAYPTTAPQDAATTTLIDHLRSETIPAAVGRSGLTVYVGGDTAVSADFAAVLAAKLPLFIAAVILLSFLLLAVVFRSIAIPLTAAVMNLLSAGAAFGVLVGVFEHGWFGSVLGVNRPGPIEAFLPVMMFSILFGLSMDYEVFLVARIHEEWLRTGDNRTAVRTGLAATGKTITAAALIMILVFGSFMLGGERVIREFGLGLAAGILVDALIIRATVIPAAMLVLGRFNWWFPARLDRVLPRVNVDHVEECPDEMPPPKVPELVGAGVARPTP